MILYQMIHHDQSFGLILAPLHFQCMGLGPSAQHNWTGLSSSSGHGLVRLGPMETECAAASADGIASAVNRICYWFIIFILILNISYHLKVWVSQNWWLGFLCFLKARHLGVKSTRWMSLGTQVSCHHMCWPRWCWCAASANSPMADRS